MSDTIQQTANSELVEGAANTTAGQMGKAAADQSSAKKTAKPKKAKPTLGRHGTNRARAESADLKPASTAPHTSTAAKSFRPGTRAEIILRKLKTTRGATLAELSEATGWQNHSIRGFLSGTVKKKLGLELVSEVGKDGVRRYRIAEDKSGS